MYTLTYTGKMVIFTMLNKDTKIDQRENSTCKYTFIWLSAESFKPVISKTFTQVVIGRPYFFDAEGWNKVFRLNND